MDVFVIPVTPYLHKAVAGRIWPSGCSLLNPDVKEQKKGVKGILLEKL